MKLMNIAFDMVVPRTAKENIHFDMTRAQMNLKNSSQRSQLHLQKKKVSLVVCYGASMHSNKPDVFDSNIGKHSHDCYPPTTLLLRPTDNHAFVHAIESGMDLVKTDALNQRGRSI